MRSRITILLVDDHAMMREGIRSLLQCLEGIEIVAEAANGRDAVELAVKLAPDIVLIDIEMPGMNGIEATRRMHAAVSGARIIALSMHSDERYVAGMFDAGAKGFLLKTCESPELLRAIDVVRQGRSYVTPDVTHIMVDRRRALGRPRPAEDGKGAPPADVLTSREREVLQLIAEGLTSKEIGARLHATLKTIETHRTNLMSKLGLHSIAGLTKYAIREGVTGLDD